jgi:ssDNA-binding Zn-finger/Zn-ribbon topoisomerase 1
MKPDSIVIPIVITEPGRQFGPCPKCQHVDINVIWRPSEWDVEGVRYVDCRWNSTKHRSLGEHFDVQCRMCGYGWTESVETKE